MKNVIYRKLSVGLKLKVVLLLICGSKGYANGFKGDMLPMLLKSIDDKSVAGQLHKGGETAGQAINDAMLSATTVLDTVTDALVMPTSTTAQIAFHRLSAEEIRLWAQSFNAGPYAVLKHKGNVPYTETQNYTPRIMKYYQQDLSQSPYEPYILAAAQKYQFDPQLIRAIIKTESNFNPQCESNKGARGLMQVMPAVWADVKRWYKIDWNYETDVYDPAKNIEVACAYLAWLRYDFLPKRFAAFDTSVSVPESVIRDRTEPLAQKIVVGQPEMVLVDADVEKTPKAKPTVTVAKVASKPVKKVPATSIEKKATKTVAKAAAPKVKIRFVSRDSKSGAGKPVVAKVTKPVVAASTKAATTKKASNTRVTASAKAKSSKKSS